MGIFDFFKGPDINEGIKKFMAEKRAVLIDVREADEYAGGHIKGSRNIPLSKFDKIITSAVTDKTMPVYVYCQSGGRSSQAASKLTKLGYDNVNNIGGIGSYKGRLEK